MLRIIFLILSIFFSVPALCATLINDTETERMLYTLVEPLATAANIPKNRLQIHIINDDDFNAFVSGGEDVYVYTGLLRQIKNPSAFQAVIAHEMGHMLGGHTAQMSERMSAEMKRTMLIQALGIGLMVAGGNPTLGAGVLAGAGGVAQQSMLAFTRDEERIADNMGVDLMHRAKLDTNGFLTVFNQMYEITGALESKINPHRINHPLTTERLNNVRMQIEKLGHANNTDKKAQSIIDSEFELIRAKLTGYLDTVQRVHELYPQSDKSDSAIYARAIANMRNGDLDIAHTGTKTLISRNPHNPYFYELLGDIEYQRGNYDAGIIAYEKSLNLTTNAPQIETALALVLTARGDVGDNARAIELCKRSLLSSPAPLTYWVLARAYGDSDIGRSDWAMAEYYNLIGKTNESRKFAKRAQKKLKKSDSEYIKSGELIK